MTKLSPKIDLRSQEDLVQALRKLSAHYCSDVWESEDAIASDGQAHTLIQLYSRMMETVIRRLNRAPDKNFLAFIDMLGLNLLAPRPAKTALSFALAKGAASRHGYVEAGTQVASEESPDDKPVVFETDESLTVISPFPMGAVTLTAGDDRWKDHCASLFDEENRQSETLFEGIDLIPHRLYLGHNDLFSFEEPRNITLFIKGNDSFRAALDQIKWYAWSEESAEALELDAHIANYESGEINFKNVGLMPETSLTGFEETGDSGKSWTNRWIYAELQVPLAEEEVPQIDSVKTTIEADLSESFSADMAFFNTFPLDLTKDFRPFGERPKFNDTFYLGFKEVFSKKDAAITLTFTLSGGITSPDTKNVALVWEYWDGKKWMELGSSEKTAEKVAAGNKGAASFSDGTEAFTKEGSVTFTCPSILPCKINGEENHWIRVRILKGNYGVEANYQEIAGTSGETKYVYLPATYAPPTFESLAISFVPVAEYFKEIVTYNNFYYQSHPVSTPFAPFRGPSDIEASLYIAFDKDISELPVTLFFPLLSGEYVPSLEGEEQKSPRLLWQYWNGSEWSSLMVEDHTKELTKREMVKFLAPEDVKKKPCFNMNLYWIRVLLTEGDFSAKPKVSGIFGNAVWARNIVSIKKEMLGSSNGEPDQVFSCAQTPLLPGQQISVRENSISEEEKKKLIEEAGHDVIKELKDDAENILELWVLWQEVDHFYFSGSHDRHYILDRKTGNVIFGDGIKGMIPPAGKNNLQCIYKAGGGMRGNLAAGTISKLRSNIPYVDKVTNPVDSEGGADQESLDEIRVRAPRTIRHRNRAVTFRDYEWIAEEASPKVARVKCLPVHNPLKQFKPGWVTVIIVPDLMENKPLPSEELLEEVRNYIFERTPENLISKDIAQVNVIPPNYLGVSVEVDVAFKSISEAKITESLISESLDRFFHPLTGGPQGKGWEFGRNVYITEVYEMVEKVKGVDYVKDIRLDANLQIFNLQLESPFTVSYNFPPRSTVSVEGGDMVFLLAEQVHKNEETRLLKVSGFKEGDFVEIYEYDDVEEKKVRSTTARLKSLSGSSKEILHFESIQIEETFPMGCYVETFLRPEGQRIKSYLTSPLEKGKRDTMEVAVPVAGDEFLFSHRDWPSNRLWGKIVKISDKIDTVFLEEDYLLYRAYKDMKIKGALKLKEKVPPKAALERSGRRYLMNVYSGEVHDLQNITPLCNLNRILKRHKRYVDSLDEIKTAIEEMDYDYCGWCFPQGMSKR